MQYWRYRAISITKYDPKFRSDSGAYLRDDWTSRSDIGKVYNEEILTLDEYLKIESTYIASVKWLCNYLDINEIQLFNIEKVRRINSDKKRVLISEELYGVYKTIDQKNSYKLDELDSILKLVLREYCRLSLLLDIDTASRVYFGFDYYMYFASDILYDKGIILEVKQNISRLGLFVY